MSQVTETTANNKVRENMVNATATAFEAAGLEVLRTASNKIAIPSVNENGTEVYVVLTISVPKGSRDGDPYDGHAEAENYAFLLEEKAKVAEARKAEKEKKIAADKAKRDREKAEAKAEQE